MLQVLAEVMCGQLLALTGTLAARDKMVEALMKKQNELVAKIADQVGCMQDLRWLSAGLLGAGGDWVQDRLPGVGLL